MWLNDEIVQVAVNFMRDSAHLRLVGASVALCGVPIGGWFIRKFFAIQQVGGTRGCEACRKKYAEILDEKSKGSRK